MRVYTEDEIKKLIKSFKEFCESKNYAMCEYKLPDIKGIDVTLVAHQHEYYSKNKEDTKSY